MIIYVFLIIIRVHHCVVLRSRCVYPELSARNTQQCYSTCCLHSPELQVFTFLWVTHKHTYNHFLLCVRILWACPFQTVGWSACDKHFQMYWQCKILRRPPHSSCASSVYVYFCEIEAGGTPQPNGPPVQEMKMKIIWKQGKSRGIKVWNKQKLGN